MALEGALVFPVFLFFMMTILLSIEAVRVQSNLCEALHQSGSHMMFQGYQVKYENSTFTEPEQEIKEYLAGQMTPYLCIAGGEQGIRVEYKEPLSLSGMVILRTEYQIKPFIFWIPIGTVRIQDSFLGHAWTGYSGNEPLAAVKEKEEYVYVTKTGTKYHRSCDCTYLKITPQAVNYEQITAYRNQSGGNYYPCKRCYLGAGGIVYITMEGGSYHNRADCSALKRTVYLIPLREAEGYSPCGKCAK